MPDKPRRKRLDAQELRADADAHEARLASPLWAPADNDEDQSWTAQLTASQTGAKEKPAFRRDSAPAVSAEDQWKKEAIARDIQAMDRVFNSKKLTSIADEWLPQERSDEAIAAALTADQVLTGLKNVLTLRGKPVTISTIRKLRLLRPDLKPVIDHAVAVLKLTRAEEKRELWEIDMTWRKVIAPRLDKDSIVEMLRAASARGLLDVVARRISQCRPDLIGEVDRAIQRLKQQG